MKNSNYSLDKRDLVGLLEIANQRIRHHHDALWKEETHYTWLVYILAAGVVFITTGSELCWTQKAIIASVLGVIGVAICLLGYLVVRREGQFLHEALQIHNRLNFALGLDKFTLEEPYSNKKLIPDNDAEVKDWEEVKSKANKSPMNLLKGIVKPSSMGIRDWFQVTLLLPIALFLTLLVLSIINALCS